MVSLVTGATGLVGFHIVHALRRAGHRPRLLARDAAKARRLVGADFDIVTGDVTDAASVAAACDGIEVVFHAAGHPEQWLADPDQFERVNVGGTRHVVQACRAAGVRRLVYTSTIDVFEARAGERFNEDVIATAPKGTPYERSKQLADRLVAQALADGLDAVFIHPAAVYGPGPAQSPGLNQFFRELRAGKLPLLLPGGMPVVFAPDLGEAHVRAAQRAGAGERFIVSERFFTLVELARAAAAASGKQRVPPVLPLALARWVSAATEALARLTNKPPLVPAGQLHFLQWGAIPDASRARKRLGLELTPLEQGLAALVAAE